MTTIVQPRLCITALRGSGGKTLTTLATIAALTGRGQTIRPFKKGPDYIDAAWMSEAAKSACYHLDLYFMSKEQIKEAFVRNLRADSIALIEGNRGLFDGVDIHGSYSTAKIASLLQTPTILVVDCTKCTNTMAAMIKGCMEFDSTVPLMGVILNRVAGERHKNILTESIEHHTGLPVLGAFPKLKFDLPERHLGLITAHEFNERDQLFQTLRELGEKHLDLDRIINLAQSATPLTISPVKSPFKGPHQRKVKVGVIKDSAFQFYYPENLEALEKAGAELIQINSLKDPALPPEIDLLYIGGGFPEVQAEGLSQNKSFRESIKYHANQGLPIYGECGAVIYLGEKLTYQGKEFSMCGVFETHFSLRKKPVGHGYADIEVQHENPFFPVGESLKGHEFHYSLIDNWESLGTSTAFKMNKGYGFDGETEGLYKNNVLVSYTHFHAAGAPKWAHWLIQKARAVQYSQTTVD